MEQQTTNSGGNAKMRRKARRAAQAQEPSEPPAQPEAPQFSDSYPSRSGKSMQISKRIWSWGTVGMVLGLLIGGGLTFTTSSHALIADICFVVAIVLFVAKWVTWEEARQQAPKKRALVMAVGIIVATAVGILAIWGNHELNSGDPLIHSSVQVTRLFLSATTAPPYVDIFYKNGGPIPTDKQILFAKTSYRSVLEMPVANDESHLAGIFSEAIGEFSKIKPQDLNWRPSLGSGEERSDRYSISSPPLNDLVDGDKVVFTIVLAQFSDTTGSYRKASCWFWVTPNFHGYYRANVSMPENWWQCYPPNMQAWEDANRSSHWHLFPTERRNGQTEGK